MAKQAIDCVQAALSVDSFLKGDRQRPLSGIFTNKSLFSSYCLLN